MKSKNRKLPISAVMVLYNNEKVLERAIKSFYDLVDELVIVHDGKCTDKSLDIAKKYTNRIYIRPHIGEAEPQRPFTYKMAKNDWILQIDADEYLSKELRDEVPLLIQRNVDIYDTPWPILQKNKLYFGPYKRMLFKKSKIYFIGVVHEYPKALSENVRLEKAKNALIHDPGYDNSSFLIFRTKWTRMARIHAKQYLADFKTLPKWNYTKNVWDYPTNVRLKHPILYGMILTTIYHQLRGLENIFKYKSLYIFKQEIYISLYFSLVFFYVKFKKI